MSDAAAEPAAVKRRPGRKALLAGLVLAPLAAAGGYFVTTSGLLPLADSDAPKDEARPPLDVVFVPLEPMIISIGQGGLARHLRFEAQLEVDPARAAEVIALMPRVVDVLNGYLRAVEVDDLEDPASLVRLRAQMLRRAQIVTGEGAVRDLLVMEFVLN